MSNWLKRLFSRTKELVDKDAEHLVYVRIPDQRVLPTPTDTEVIAANHHYLRIWVAEMFLAKRRQWFTQYTPIVHSVVRLNFGASDAPEVELPHVAGPLDLHNAGENGLSEDRLGKVISVNHAVTGLLPFRGGTVQLAAGLLRAHKGNRLDHLVGVLGDLSRQIAVPQLSAAMNVVQPLSQGLGALLHNDGDSLWLGLCDTFVGAGSSAAHNVLRPGYLAAVNADAGSFAHDQLCVRDGHLCLGPDVATAEQLTGHDYMLFRIESRAHRETDEWEQLTSINQPWKDALRHLQAMQPDKAVDSMRLAIYATQTSADLTTRDRNEVIRRLKERFRQAKAQYDLSSLEAVGNDRGIEPADWSLGELMAGDRPAGDEDGTTDLPPDLG